MGCCFELPHFILQSLAEAAKGQERCVSNSPSEKFSSIWKHNILTKNHVFGFTALLWKYELQINSTSTRRAQIQPNQKQWCCFYHGWEQGKNSNWQYELVSQKGPSWMSYEKGTSWTGFKKVDPGNRAGLPWAASSWQLGAPARACRRRHTRFPIQLPTNIVVYIFNSPVLVLEY